MVIEMNKTGHTDPRPSREASQLEVQSAVNDLRRIVRVLRESSRAVEEHVGVSGAQLFVLQALADSSAVSLNELAERTLTHQSTVSVVVKKLVERGLVSRVPSEVDGRRVEITLTREGRALLKRAPGVPQRRLIEGIERLTPAERRQIAVLLHRLAETMRVSEEEPAMFFEEPDEGERKKGVTRRARD
jgi:DNA-binding MarR family transcriptional regulator